MLKNKTSVVIGASPNTDRYSYKATVSLQKHGYRVFPIGMKKEKINDLDILIDRPVIENVDTVTLYVGLDNQPMWYDYILSLHPKRLIFNPGTYNPEFEKMAKTKGIETLEACTLVLLSIGDY